MVLDSFQSRDVLLKRLMIEKGPTVFAVCADGGCWTFFLVSHFFLPLTPGYGLIKIEILSQRAFKP